MGPRGQRQPRDIWSDVDLDLSISQTRRRPVYAHGFGETCGKKAAGSCPSRVLVNGESGDTKSDAGRCVVGLPVQLVELLREQRRAQDADREHARQLWQEGRWVFTSTVGKPLIPNSDYDRWKALLKEAGVRDGRLHDARHTAATVLLGPGRPGADGYGDHGLVEHLDGGPLSARHRPDPAGRRRSGGQPALV
jgi:integrase